MLDPDPPEPSWCKRMHRDLLTFAGEAVRWSWARCQAYGAIGPRSRVARRFGSFGPGSIICFPGASLVNEGSIHIGAATMVAPQVSLSAGWGPGHPGLPDRVLTIGDRCLIGQGSSIVAHLSIEIGDDVWTGHDVYITDMNHGYVDLDTPIARQHQPERPVVIGSGSWLGHGVVVLPGVTIGRHCVIGAGSVVTDDVPSHSVAVGSPARIIRRHDPVDGWVSVGSAGPFADEIPDEVPEQMPAEMPADVPAEAPVVPQG